MPLNLSNSFLNLDQGRRGTPYSFRFNTERSERNSVHQVGQIIRQNYMGKNNNQSLEPGDSKVPEEAAFDLQNRKFETFEEEEKKSSDGTEKSNKTAGDINLAMG